LLPLTPHHVGETSTRFAYRATKIEETRLRAAAASLVSASSDVVVVVVVV
jgi:hypothetical protein